jgi:hypothetical protein
MRASQIFDQWDPQAAVVLKLIDYVRIDDVSQKAGNTDSSLCDGRLQAAQQIRH